MIYKTGSQVQDDVFQLIRNSDLASSVNGSVYKDGYRPRDSEKEDIVVIFTTGLADEIQTGVVTINIYVPDVDPYANGVFVKDGLRCSILEEAADSWLDSIQSDYRFTLNNTIHTTADEDINQHFVVVKLNYKLLTI